MLCPNCETQNDDNARLCVECGFPLSGAVSRGAGAISPAKTAAPYQKRSNQAITGAIPSVQSASASQTGGYSVPVSQHPVQPNTYPSQIGQMRQMHQAGQTSQLGQTGQFSHTGQVAQTGFLQGFSWDELQQSNPAQGLFESTASFPAIAPDDPLQGVPAQTARIQEPQIVQVDLLGREIKPDSTQQMPPVQAAPVAQPSTGDLYDDVIYDDVVYDFDTSAYGAGFASDPLDDYQSTYNDPYGNAAETPYPQDDFDAFYQGETTLHANTMKFDDDRTTVQPAKSYANTRTKASKSADKRKKQTVAQRNYRIPQKKQGLNGKQRGLVIGGIIAIVAALVIVVGFAFGVWGGIPVPNVENMSQSEAVKILEENGFETKIVQVKSDEIEGRVLSTEPRAGSFAEEGSEITVNVAVARTIPDVVGMDLEKALAALEESGYTNVKTQVEKSNGPEDIVVSSTPAADTRAKSTMEITLTITENYKVPSISGMTYDQAVSAIREAGLVASAIYIDTDEYPDGTIIGTDPEVGTRVDEGSTVGINIARLRGVELNALATQLLSAGNTVNVGGVSYQVESLTSVSYQGNDVVAFTFQGRPYVEFFGETLFASSTQTVSGQIQYNSANEVVSII